MNEPNNVCPASRACHENYVHLRSLDERPAVLPAKGVPRVHVVRVVGDSGALLLSEGVVVVVHDDTEILVIDNAGAAGAEYLAVRRE